MELGVQLLAKLLENRQINVVFPGLELSAGEILDAASYQALCQIHDILRDDSLSDPDCFLKIEAIVRVFEGLGAGCEGRHDL